MPAKPPTFLYLHGFASGPQSTKAKYFAEHLRDAGAKVLVPDLNRPTFEKMTLTSQLDVVHRCMQQIDEGDQLVMIGSSMGGLIATLVAQDLIPLSALVLLAPGFGLPRRWMEMLGQSGLKEWQTRGAIEVFHYALNKTANLDYNFIVDAQKYKTEDLKVDVPTLVFHGKNDDTVPLIESKNFQKWNPDRITLEILDDDHHLTKSLDKIWLRTNKFLKDLNN